MIRALKFGSFLFVLIVLEVWAADPVLLPFADYFKECKVGQPGFDECMKNALNAVRPFFVTGVAEYKIRPFDPHYFKRVTQTRGGPNANFTVVFTDTQLRDWSAGEVTNFESDLANNLITIEQTLPITRLTGQYALRVHLSKFTHRTKGDYSFRILNWKHIMTITRVPTTVNGTSTPGPIKVDLRNTGIGLMTWHFDRLVGGKAFKEKFVDRVINNHWSHLFGRARPILDALASQGFTDIFNESFATFPFDTFFST